MTEELLVFCRCAVALTFAASALGKALDMAAFRDAVDRFRVVRPRRAGIVAGAVVAVEAAVVVGAAVGRGALPVAFGLAVGLLVALTAALVRVVRRSDRLRCNCFGAGSREVSWYDVARNVLLVAVAGTGLGAWGAADPAAGPDTTDSLLLALMAVGFVLVVVNLADVVETLRTPVVLD